MRVAKLPGRASKTGPETNKAIEKGCENLVLPANFRFVFT